MDKHFTIALIEDDFDDQYLMEKAVKASGYDITLDISTSGKAYFEKLKALDTEKNCLPDLILLDLNLPGWDGRETLKKIRSLPKLNTMPIIIYTTSRSQTDMEEAYHLGANSYVVKAMSFEKIQRNIKLICDYWFSLVGVEGISR